MSEELGVESGDPVISLKSVDPLGADAAEIQDPRAFIALHTRIDFPPHVREIALHLASTLVPIWHATEADLARIGLPPPFWAFAWAGGQGLARYVLDHPDWVAGAKGLDFGAGSALIAIAAMKAGAAHMVASDIDPFARTAILMNAEANEVAITPSDEDFSHWDGARLRQQFDFILAGDICYDREDALRFFAMLQDFVGEGGRVLLGDPGRSYLPKSGLALLAEYQVTTTREIEDDAVKRTRVWRVLRAPASRSMA